jgi:hypothetical protein
LVYYLISDGQYKKYERTLYLSWQAVPYPNTAHNGVIRTCDEQKRNDQLFIAGVGSGKAILHHYPVLEEGRY